MPGALSCGWERDEAVEVSFLPLLCDLRYSACPLWASSTSSEKVRQLA